MSRLRLALNVCDIGQAVDLSSTLFATEVEDTPNRGRYRPGLLPRRDQRIGRSQHGTWVVRRWLRSHSPDIDLVRRLTAEAIGTAFLLIAVVGSGIMATRLTDDTAIQLLANAAATAGALVGIITMFAVVSGAHLNPTVTLTARSLNTITARDTALYIAAQITGACLGTILANAMFDLPAIELSTQARSSGALWLSEVLATIGLLLVIHSCVRTGRSTAVPYAVAAWIAGAYWFTSSTSFANPAVTIGRILTDTFTGIAPASAPMFIAMQILGTATAIGLIRLLYPNPAVNQTLQESP